MERLVPANVKAPAENAGRIPFAFARRFFLLLFIGLAWIAPAWRQPRLLYAMVAWDVIALAAWAWDLGRIPKPGQLEIRRVWTEPLGLAQRGRVTIEVRNSSGVSVSVQMTDEAPDTFIRDLPEMEITAPAGNFARASYSIEPRVRGDAKFGDVWIRYRSPLCLAERWACARLGQKVRVYPNFGEAQKMRIYLIRSRQIEVEKRLKRQRGHGREFESLREYRAGDEFRDISWSATARRGKLITKRRPRRAACVRSQTAATRGSWQGHAASSRADRRTRASPRRAHRGGSSARRKISAFVTEPPQPGGLADRSCRNCGNT